MKEFLNTPLAAWLKVFVATILSLVLINISKGIDLFSLNWKEIVSGAVASLLPVIINWLNPNDPRYGLKNNDSKQ
jgi:hypothetical protein